MRRGREEHVNFETNQLISQGGEPVELIISGSILESYVLAIDIAQFTESRRNDSPAGPTRADSEPADLWDLCCCCASARVTAARITVATTREANFYARFLPPIPDDQSFD